jgi:hypothetical protein
MCLILTVQLAKADSSRAAEVAQAAGLPAPTKRWWQRLTQSASDTLTIPGPEGGCGCSFLSDNASWGAPTWDMIPETLPRLVKTLRAISQHTTAGFSLDALWVGDSPDGECNTTIEALVDLVEQSHLGTKTRYRVSPE